MKVSEKNWVGIEPMKKKRSLFEELKQGIEEINQWRAGKITLKTYTVEKNALPAATQKSSGIRTES